MSLLGGDLTTVARVQQWVPDVTTQSQPLLQQLIQRCTALIYNKLNRSRIYSQNFIRYFDGVGTGQLVLPDWPVTSIQTLQVGFCVVSPSIITSGSLSFSAPNTAWGYTFPPWLGNLPGDPAVVQFRNGFFFIGAQNVVVNYTAGYLVSSEPQTVPLSAPYVVTTNQFQGIQSHDDGVVYATGGLLSPVATITTGGQYLAPVDANPGVYSFGLSDAGKSLFISYSFIPADLEEACIQMVAERYSYRSRVGQLGKSLGGQETMRYLRGGGRPDEFYYGLPPEVVELIQPYISVIPPATGGPV